MADEDRDPETGQFTARFTDEELVSAVADLEPAGTTDIAERFDCSQPAAYKRLKALEEADKVKSKMVGNSLVWMPIDESSTE